MAKGSVRKKGKKWYGRFYIEDESGRKVQKEFAGTESKAETEAMLRKAIADYEEKQFVGKAENITVGNFYDRFLNHYVVDFIYVSLINFPVFNVADIYVTVSVAVFLLLYLLYYKDEDFAFLHKNAKKEESDG